MTLVDAPLTTDVPCVNCAYNLRTKRPSEVCPECGGPIAPSIEAHRKNNRLLRNAGRAAGGAWLLVFAVVSTELWLEVAIHSIRGGAGLRDLLLLLFWPMELLQIAAAVAALLGVAFLITGAAPAPSSAPSSVRSFGCLLLLAITPLAALGTKLATTVPLTGVRRWMWLDGILPPVALAATGAAAVLYLVGGWYLLRLARRQGWKILALFSAFLFPVAALIELASGITVAIWWHIFPNWPFGSPLFEAYGFLRHAIDNGGPFITPVLAIYFVVLASRLRNCSRAPQRAPAD